MHKYLAILFFLCLSSLTLLAQDRPSRIRTQHEIKVNPKTVNYEQLKNDLRRRYAALDSMYYSLRLDSLEAVYNYAKRDTVSYTSFTFVYGQVFSDVDGLNAELRGAGFPSISSSFHSFGYFFSFRRGRWLHEPLFIFNAPNTAESGEYEVSVSGGQLSYSLGYDVLPFERVQLYPVAGLNVQFTSLSLDRTSGPNAVTLPEALATLDNAYFTKTDLNLFGGAQLDYHILHNRRGRGVIVGLRYTHNLPLTDGNFRDKNDDKTAYQPGLSLSKGSQLISLVKLYGRVKYRN